MCKLKGQFTPKSNLDMFPLLSFGDIVPLSNIFFCFGTHFGFTMKVENRNAAVNSGFMSI